MTCNRAAHALAALPRLLRRGMCLLLLSWLSVNACAETLVSVDSATYAAPPSDTARWLLTLDARLFALDETAAWQWDERAQTWQRASSAVPGIVAAVASDGARGFLLLAAEAGGPIRRVVRFNPDASTTAGLPDLPEALASAQAVVWDERIFVAGIDTAGRSHFLSLNAGDANATWLTHEAWPGSSSALTSISEQTNGIFVTVRDASAAGDRIVQWKAEEGWIDRGRAPQPLLAGMAASIGQAHILYLSRSEPGSAGGSVLAYHTITSSWAPLAEATTTLTTSATAWKNGIVWLRAGQNGSPLSLHSSQIRSTDLLLAPLDWVMIIVYLVSMLGMGLYFYLREKRNSTSDFFVGGRKIPFWAAGVSLYAANTSSISYIAIPAKSFETNWQYLTNNLVAVLGLMFVAVWIVPLLRRLNLMSVFAYLETRFHPVIRMLASALCILVQIGSRMSVILFLPALAIATITGIDVKWSILIMGVFTMIYTAMGGMKAVVWTDFVQLIVKMGGIVFAIAFVVMMMDGGTAQLLAIADAEDKAKLFDFSLDLTKATVWGFIFLVLFDVVLTFPKDQVLMQRVLSTESAKEAGKSVWTFAAIMIPGGFMFYMVGTALFAYYKTHPERLNPLLPIDSIFPLFIAAELPMGVRGLIIAGILAAAMATLSSIMNSVATLASVDFYEKWVPNPDPKVSVRFAEAMTVVTGLAGMGLALLLSTYDIHSLFDVSIELAGLLGGGFAGAYTLGMFTRRANWQGVAIGIATAIALTTLAWSMNLVHPYFYLAISILLCIVVGYLASLLFPAPTAASLVGLTIYEKRPTSGPQPAGLMQND